MDVKPESRQPVKLTIFNQNYTLSSLGDPTELIQVAREVDELMHSIAEKVGSSDSSRVAVLACLHMADRMRALEALHASVNNRAERFSTLLEEVLDTK